jgi:hypothetical protein
MQGFLQLGYCDGRRFGFGVGLGYGGQFELDLIEASGGPTEGALGNGAFGVYDEGFVDVVYAGMGRGNGGQQQPGVHVVTVKADIVVKKAAGFSFLALLNQGFGSKDKWIAHKTKG